MAQKRITISFLVCGKFLCLQTEIPNLMDGAVCITVIL